MKSICLASFFSIFCSCSMAENNPPSEPETVAHVDLERYMGRWYEIASYPQWFEKGMSDVSALYSFKGDRVEVVNSGIKKGVLKEVKGKAKVVDGYGGGRLKVSFFPLFWGEYWIIDLADDYSWVVVSNSKRSTLWILSRTKTVPLEVYNAICESLVTNGFDLSRLVLMKNN